MKKSKLPEEKELQLKCDCGCTSQILFTFWPDKTLKIDIRDSGRHKWHGVCFYEEGIEKIKEFLKS